MSLDIVKSQNMAQLANLVSNPLFLNILKTATKTSGTNNTKYDDLLKQLEKLSGSIASQNSSQTAQADATTQATGNASGLSESELLLLANMLHNQSLGQTVDDLIGKADELEAMLNLEIVPPDDIIAEFFGKLREIIGNLDNEVRKLQKEQLDKKMKEVITLAPSSDTASGFAEGLKLVVK